MNKRFHQKLKKFQNWNQRFFLKSSTKQNWCKLAATKDKRSSANSIHEQAALCLMKKRKENASSTIYWARTRPVPKSKLKGLRKN
jgi:hypothetical protein